MTSIGELTLNLTQDASLLEAGLKKAEERAKASGEKMAESFEELDKSVVNLNETLASKFGDGLIEGAERGRQAVKDLSVDISGVVDFSSLGGVDLSPLREEIEKIEQTLFRGFGDIEYSEISDLFSRSASSRPSDSSRSRRRSRRRRGDRDDYIRGQGVARTSTASTRNISGSEINDRYTYRPGFDYLTGIPIGGGTDRRNPPVLTLGATPDQFPPGTYDTHVTDYGYSRFRGNGFEDLPEVNIPAIDRESLEALTEFFNQSQAIESTTKSLVGFIDAWFAVQGATKTTAEEVGLAEETFESIIDTMRQLDTSELERMNEFFTNTSGIDDTASSMVEFATAWNNAVAAAKNRPDGNAAEGFKQIGDTVAAAGQAIDNLFKTVGERSIGSTLSRNLERSANEIFNTIPRYTTPRFTGGPVQAGGDYTVAEKGAELGRFGDQIVLFKEPTAITPKRSGVIYNAHRTETIINQAVNPEKSIFEPDARGDDLAILKQLKHIRQDLSRTMQLSGNTYDLRSESGKPEIQINNLLPQLIARGM